MCLGNEQLDYLGNFGILLTKTDLNFIQKEFDKFKKEQKKRKNTAYD